MSVKELHVTNLIACFIGRDFGDCGKIEKVMDKG